MASAGGAGVVSGWRSARTCPRPSLRRSGAGAATHAKTILYLNAVRHSSCKTDSVNADPASVRLLAVPYDSGHFDLRMGAGPLALTRAGAAERLRSRGHHVDEQVLQPISTWRAELQTTFELHGVIAEAVSAAVSAGQAPLLLSGNCNATLGVLAGLGASRRLGLVWLDAHGDFNTPEQDGSGFVDGHGLAMAVGRCWRAATAMLPGFVPVPEEDVLLIGARDLDEAQQQVLRESELTWLPPAQARVADTVVKAVNLLAGRVDAVHLHVDLDVYDPSIAPANSYAAPDGLSAADVQSIAEDTAGRLPIVSSTLAAYDPELDSAGRMRDTALDLLELVAGLMRPASAGRVADGEFRSGH
jgi:arginase